MSDEPAAPSPASSPAAAKSGKDRKVKLGFLAVAIVAVGLVYWVQRQPALLTDWSQDLPGTLRKAAQEKRRVLVLFLPSILSDWDRRMLIANHIEKNERRIDQGHFLRVRVAVGEANEDPDARAYGIKELPTFLMLGPDGKELKRLAATQDRIAETALTAFVAEANSPSH